MSQNQIHAKNKQKDTSRDVIVRNQVVRRNTVNASFKVFCALIYVNVKVAKTVNKSHKHPLYHSTREIIS